jgi:TldD protein
MAGRDLFDAIEFLKRDGDALMRRFVRSHRDAAWAELRFEAVSHRSGAAVNGEPREGNETETAALGVTVHARDRLGAVGVGNTGAEIGEIAAQRAKLMRAISGALEEAYQRARASAREKGALMHRLGAGAAALAGVAPADRAPIRETVEAIYQRDPRAIDSGELKRIALESSRAVAGLGGEIAFNWIGAMTELRHEVFLDSAGSFISQAFAFSQGDCYVVAQTAAGHQESYDTIGQQRGFECLETGWRGELMPNADLGRFSVELAREARELAAAPMLKPPEGEVVVVTDPHFNALVAHEVVGHPSEADRALKMEAAYAGRSWFLRSLADNQLGRRIGSPILSACSDPSLDGYGQYRFDHEGTPGRRVTHIELGVFAGFLHSRATAAALGVEPNGSARASEGWHVPLIRMSNTFFMPGESEPERIIADVEHGYYVCGHAIPSIAESRENFRISARRVYEIDNGRIGRLYRSGSLIADSKSFFMNVDAAGNDLRLIAIPNCGKGQPMQVKRMSNGGPTLRSRARLGGG